MRGWWAAAAVASLGGCTPIPDTVRIEGTVRADIDAASGPFAGAELSFVDDRGRRVASAQADASGAFSARIPAGEPFHVVIDGPDHVPAGFSGVAGLDATYAVPDGTLHGVTAATRDAWDAMFAGCPSMGQGGAVFGEPRIAELVDDDGEHPGVSSAVAEVWDPDRERVVAAACYLDPVEGEAYDPGADRTGVAGVFAIYGVPERALVLSVGLEVLPGSFTWDDSTVYVPEGGVAPRFPAWVHFPL